MKIALVLDDSLDRPDGVQQYVRTVGKYMEDAGHEVHYVCSGDTPDDLDNVYSLATNAPVSFNGNRLRIPLAPASSVLREFLRAQQFDVIHVQTPHSPLFSARLVHAARALQGASVRIVGTFHILPDGKLSSFGTWILGRVLRSNLTLFDAFCATSAPTVTFARRTFGIEARVIPNAVDVNALAKAAAAREPLAPDDGRRTVAYLGRLVARKGVRELIDAVAALPTQVKRGIRVVIGGKGPLETALRTQVQARGLSETVEFAGFVSEEDKPRFYADADVAVFPATGGESFGIVLIEAMASGAKTVLGGDNPGYMSVLGDDPAVTVNARDTAAFAATLEAFITDDHLRSRVNREQQQRVRQFDLTVVGAQIEALYRGD